jgi:hypothetical protein
MQTTKVEQDQFRWINHNNTLAHIPTGATFSWKYPSSGSGDLIIQWKYAADVLPTGECFPPWGDRRNRTPVDETTSVP